MQLLPSRGEAGTCSDESSCPKFNLDCKWLCKSPFEDLTEAFCKYYTLTDISCLGIIGVFSPQWAFYRAGQNCCSGDDTERRSHASASLMKTSPIWAITLLLTPPAAVKSLAAFPAGSSNAFHFAHQANQKAKPLLQMEEPARRVMAAILGAAKGPFWTKPPQTSLWKAETPAFTRATHNNGTLTGFCFFSGTEFILPSKGNQEMTNSV